MFKLRPLRPQATENGVHYLRTTETGRFGVLDLGSECVDVCLRTQCMRSSPFLRADMISTESSSAHSLQSKTPYYH